MGKAHAPPPPPCPLSHGQWSVSSAPFLASCHGVVEGRGGGPVFCDSKSLGKYLVRERQDSEFRVTVPYPNHKKWLRKGFMPFKQGYY